MKTKLKFNPSLGKVLAIGGFIALGSQVSRAQTYSFENSMLPANWTVENATVSFTSEHSTDADVALVVEVAPGQTGVINCPFPTPKQQTKAKYSFHVEIYSYKTTETPLVVNFYDEAGALHLSGNAVMNYKGWMPYYRSYTKDYGENGMTKKAARMSISIDNSLSAEPVKLCFDNWKLDASLSTVMALPISVKDAGNLANQTQQPLMLYSYSYKAAHEVPLTPATAEEKAAIASIKASLPQAPDAADTDLQEARTFVQGLNIKRNADGSVKLGRIFTKASDYNKNNEVMVLQHLNALAASDDPADSKMFTDFMDAVLDANIFYRFPQLKWSTYADVRLIPRLMLSLIPKMNDAQITEWLKTVRWITEEGWSNAPLDYFASRYNSDILYLCGGSNYYLSCAVNDPDPDVAARELRSFKKMLELVLTPVSGGYEIMKPDGCGFHHGVHYNNYMYSFNPWITSAYALKDTPFCVGKQAYDRIKAAILTCYSMSNRSIPYSNPDDPNDPTNNLYAKSLAGRHPFDGGQVNQFFTYIFQLAIELSSKYYGGSPDPELAAAYNYYTMTDTYQVAAKDFTGFYQYNYSPVGIYRTDDWVVTMRCPTTAAWGAEIYSNKNRFGRYQATGSMEVMYNGRKSNSGMPLIAAGYDWNVVPGTTTVHYTDWKSMLPNGNLTTRFDQFSETTDYSGALAWNLGKAGIFSCEYEQSDAHSNGNVCYTEDESTHLKFHKTILAVDGMLFNMGSDISTKGQYNDSWITATNLFQEVGDDLTDFSVNGDMMSRNADAKNLDCNSRNIWMVSPKGTGIIVPKGNRNVIVKYGTQEGPHGDGTTYDSAPETAVGAKAYINHGVKVSEEKYSYLMVPGTTAEKLKGSADEYVDRFNVISSEGSFHGIYYKPQALTALSFYAPTENTGLDFVKSIDSQMLVMHQKQPDGHMALALCCPNLHPNRLSSTLCDWVSSGTDATVTVDGEWLYDGDTKNAQVSAVNGSTVINVALNDGLPVYLDLKPAKSGVNELSIGDLGAKVSSHGDEIVVTLSGTTGGDVAVDVYDMNGMSIGKAMIVAGSKECRVNVTNSSAVTVVRLTSSNEVKTVKVIR